MSWKQKVLVHTNADTDGTKILDEKDAFSSKEMNWRHQDLILKKKIKKSKN